MLRWLSIDPLSILSAILKPIPLYLWAAWRIPPKLVRSLGSSLAINRSAGYRNALNRAKATLATGRAGDDIQYYQEFVVSVVDTVYWRITSPKVASDGQDYLLLWTDYRNLLTTGADIYGARISGMDGTVFDPEGFPMAENPGHDSLRSVFVWDNQYAVFHFTDNSNELFQTTFAAFNPDHTPQLETSLFTKMSASPAASTNTRLLSAYGKVLHYSNRAVGISIER